MCLHDHDAATPAPPAAVTRRNVLAGAAVLAGVASGVAAGPASAAGRHGTPGRSGRPRSRPPWSSRAGRCSTP